MRLKKPFEKVAQIYRFFNSALLAQSVERVTLKTCQQIKVITRLGVRAPRRANFCIQKSFVHVCMCSWSAWSGIKARTHACFISNHAVYKTKLNLTVISTQYIDLYPHLKQFVKAMRSSQCSDFQFSDSMVEKFNL
jgi:hypothetical protein